MGTETREERRKEHREIRIDRRKSDIDLIEHVVLGMRRAYDHARSDDRPPRSRSKEK